MCVCVWLEMSIGFIFGGLKGILYQKMPAFSHENLFASFVTKVLGLVAVVEAAELAQVRGCHPRYHSRG